MESERAFSPARLSWEDVRQLFKRARVQEHGKLFRLHYFAQTDWRPKAAQHRVLAYRFEGRSTSTDQVCFDALKRTAGLLCGERIGWRKPRKPIDVYLFDVTTQAIRPRPSTHRRGRAVIIRLGVGGGWPTTDWEVRSLGATAAHEMCHAMLLAQSADSAWTSEPSLLWLSEGIAVWLQAVHESGSLERALAREGEWLSYASRWIRQTEAPLDWPLGACQAFMFVQYLTRAKGIGALHELSGAKVESAWDVVSKMTGAAPDHVFADYAVQAYWLNEPKGYCYAPAIVKRFGGICPSPSAMLAPGERCKFSGEITAFGRRYFRIQPRGANRFAVKVTVGGDCVAIFACASTDDFRRPGNPTRITAPGEIRLETAGHIFIVVAGRSAASSKPFAFEVAAR